MKNRNYAITTRMFSFAAALMGAAVLAHGAPPDAGSVAATLNSAETVRTIQTQEMDSRAQLLSELNARIEAGTKAMADLSHASAKLDADAKDRFTAATNDVKEKEKILHESIKAAEKADAASWADARTKLAADFQAYAAAVAQAEAASQAGIKAGETPKN